MLNKALRLLRVFHDLPQKDLADKLEISPSYLSELENNIKQPSIEVINKYSVVFNLAPSSILLFSEQLDSKRPADKVRVNLAGKIIKILEWVEAKAIEK